jgi:hypothetical protein
VSAIDWHSYFTLGATSFTLGGVGGFAAGILKETVLQRSFESWKSRRALQAAYRRFRDPIVLSAVELCDRLHELSEFHHGDFMNAKHLILTKSDAPCTNSADDPYFLRYKVISSLYRLCAFLGWLELYRQEITFLDSGHAHLNKRFETCITKIRSAMADGFLNTADDWIEWSDSLIFREEQRAIGEVMIASADGIRNIIGYSVFSRLLEDRTASSAWINVGLHFLAGLSGPRNFRRIRVKLLVCNLLDLIEILDRKRLTERRKSFRPEAVAVLQSVQAASAAAGK